MTHATYDGTTATRTGLRRGKGWHLDGRTTGDLLKMDARGDDLRGWALSASDRDANRTLYPLNETAAPTYDAEEESITESLDFNAGTQEIDQTWSKPPLDAPTRLQRRQAKLNEGRQMLMDAIGREGPAWTTWRAAVDEQNTGLRRSTIAPRDIVWPTPPKPLNII